MQKDAVFTMKLEPDLRAEFMAAAEASQRPASQVVRELMRDFVRRQQDMRVIAISYGARSLRRVSRRARDGAAPMPRSRPILPRVAPGSPSAAEQSRREDRLDAGGRAGRAVICDYLDARDPDAAARIDHLFGDAVARLTEFPMLGHEGEIAARAN